MTIPKRTLGSTGETVTVLGLGGEGVLRTFGYEREAYDLINRALDLGITYCESARAYSGSESYYGLALKERRNDVFLTSKSHARDKAGALAHLDETLTNMKTDRIDLWQVHDVRTEADIRQIFGSGGAIEAFDEAKKAGKARFVGVTGHHDPEILLKCLDLYEFDTVLLPVNPAEPSHASFPDIVLPRALEKGMGVIAMKVYVRGFVSKLPWFDSMEPFLKYALSHDVSTAVIGCDSIKHLENNVRFASDFSPMAPDEMDELKEKVVPYAASLLYYKP